MTEKYNSSVRRRWRMSMASCSFWTVLLLIIELLSESGACHVCASLSSTVPSVSKWNGLGFALVKNSFERRPLIVAGVVLGHKVFSHSPFLKTDKAADQQDDSKDQDAATDKDHSGESSDNMSAAMITSIGIYKKFISPLLPPACRFVPTCSQYGVQAITEFGPSKGAILTAWRLLRCSPLGGKGYDPPKWPPVPYTYRSY